MIIDGLFIEKLARWAFNTDYRQFRTDLGFDDDMFVDEYVVEKFHLMQGNLGRFLGSLSKKHRNSLVNALDNFDPIECKPKQKASTKGKYDEHIKVDVNREIEGTLPSMNWKQTLKESEEIIRMNCGRILKVEFTLSNNIYRTIDETSTITITHKETK